LPVSNRFAAPTGAIRGVLVAVVEPAYFQRIYDSMDTGAKGFVTLFTRRGWIAARSPFDDGLLGRNWADSPMFRLHLPKSETGTVRQVVVADGVERVYSYRALKDYPVIVALGLSLTDILAPWRVRTWRDGGLLLIALSGLAGVALALVRQLRRRETAEKARRESEARFHSLTELSSDWYWEQDAQFRFVEFSPSVAGRSGSSVESHIGKTRWELPAVGVSEARWAEHRAMLEAHQPFRDFEYRRITGRGDTIWMSASGVPIFDDQGRFKGYRGIGREITERKLREALLDGEKQVLEMIARNEPLEHILTALMRVLEAQSPGMLCSVLLLDADGVHLRHGAAPSLPEDYMRAIDGVAIGEGVGSCGTAAIRREPVYVEDIATDPLWSEYRELALRHELRACWSTPIFDTQRKVLGTVAIYYRRPGRPTAYHQWLIGIATHIGAIAIGRQQTDAALQNMTRRLEVALEGSRVSVWESDLRSNEIWLSAGWAGYLGKAAVETRTTAAELLALVHPNDRESVAAVAVRAMKGEIASYAIEHRVKAESGEWKWILSRGQVIERAAGGRPLRMSGTNTDITERKRIEDQLVAFNSELEGRVASRTAELMKALEAGAVTARAKSEFMNNVTHELRTPLNSIIGFAELLKDEMPGPLNAKQAAFAADILASGQQLLALVEGVLEMSRLDVTGTLLKREPVEIGAALGERVAARRKAAEARGVSIALKVAADAGSANLDPKALRRMFDALLDNAVKFNREGGQVAVSARRAGGALEIAVADTGIGIAREDLAKLFKPLAQLDAGPARRHSGVGLGLALARGLAELHGGTLTVESELGKSSIFTLRFPAQGKP
jgi:PAS domain S-box-containing protein